MIADTKFQRAGFGTTRERPNTLSMSVNICLLSGDGHRLAAGALERARAAYAAPIRRHDAHFSARRRGHDDCRNGGRHMPKCALTRQHSSRRRMPFQSSRKYFRRPISTIFKYLSIFASVISLHFYYAAITSSPSLPSHQQILPLIAYLNVRARSVGRRQEVDR